MDVDGNVTCLLKETGIANGMAFTGDARHFYWTDSTNGRIYRFAYDRSSGTLGERELFHQATEGSGTPDGLTLDEHDRVWSARWGGFSVLRLGVDGEVAERVAMPVERVASVAFGGPELDTLYVSTAAGSPGGTGADGTLYRTNVGARGRAEYRSRIRLG
jgi:D-xylonolactonase